MTLPDIETVAMPRVTPGPLAPLAEEVAHALMAAKHTVTVVESTTAGLIQAALQSVAGASVYTTCGAVTYHSSHSFAVLGCDMSAPRASGPHAYMQAKKTLTLKIARRMRAEVDAVWSICEGGACGPSFNVPGIAAGFSVITISGPVERAVLVQSTHANREENMWGFAKAALDLLLLCIKEHEKASAAGSGSTTAVNPQLLAAREDRYGGVELEVLESEEARSSGANAFRRTLAAAVALYAAAGKRGLWLRVPFSLAQFAAAARDESFQLHHANAGYIQLTRWLPPDAPSSLPLYAHTQIGVGGVVVNKAGQVLMVQERVSPVPLFQGSWKLPGGLADPGEDFGDTVAREVREETGIEAALVGLVSMRHSHGFRFGVGDLYVLVKMLAEKEDIHLDAHELVDAQWMSPETIRSLVAPHNVDHSGKVSENNWKMIENALFGSLIVATPLPNARGPRPTLLYTSSSFPSSSSSLPASSL